MAKCAPERGQTRLQSQLQMLNMCLWASVRVYFVFLIERFLHCLLRQPRYAQFSSFVYAATDSWATDIPSTQPRPSTLDGWLAGWLYGWRKMEMARVDKWRQLHKWRKSHLKEHRSATRLELCVCGFAVRGLIRNASPPRMTQSRYCLFVWLRSRSRSSCGKMCVGGCCRPADSPGANRLLIRILANERLRRRRFGFRLGD